MQQLTWLRATGAIIAVALFFHTVLGIFDDLVRPAVRAHELFVGDGRPVAEATASARIAATLSVDGDLLAGVAAQKAAKALRGTDASMRAEDNKAAQDAATAALGVSPIRPALWLALGGLEASDGKPATAALKMSYLTGSVPVEVAFSRLQTVMSTQAATDEEIRLLALSDVRSTLTDGTRFEAPLIAAYVKASKDGKSLLMDAAQTIKPAFGATLKRY